MTQSKKQNSLNITKSLKAKLVFALLLTLALYALLPQVESLKNSYQTISRANLAYLGLALGFVLVSYLPASAVLLAISYFKLRFWRTVLVQIANGFTNRILPAGAGGLATSALYLIKQDRARAKAGYLALLNNLLGVVGHGLLIFCLFIVSPTPLFYSVNFHVSRSLFIIVGLVMVGLILVYLAFKQVRRFTDQAYKSISWISSYCLKHPIRLLLGLLAAMLTTICYALALYFCAQALGVHLTALQIFFVLSVGVVSVAITPTPGGLGGAEAAITAALVALDVEPALALSVTLAYRLLTYWLPILPGFIALQAVIRKKYI